LKFGPNPKYIRSWYINGKLIPDTAVSFKRTYAAGNVIVLMKLTTDSGCVYNDSVKFVINSAPSAKTILLTAKNLCMNQKFIAKTISAGTQVWTIGKDTVSKIDSVKYAATVQGKYILKHKIVDANGCFDVSQDTFVVNGIPNAAIQKSPDSAICQGGAYLFSAVDTSNILKWKLRFSQKDSIVMNLKSVTIKNDCSIVLYATSIAGCLDSSYGITMYHPQPKKLKIRIVKPAFYPGDTIVLAVNPNATWPKDCHAEWSKPINSIDSILKFRVSDTGLLVFEVKNVNNAGCQSDTSFYAQYFGPSATNYLNIEQLVTYPNPNNGSFSLRISSEIGSIQIMNLRGQQIRFDWKESDVRNQLDVHLSNVKSGLYLIQGQYKNGVKFVSKFEIL